MTRKTVSRIASIQTLYRHHFMNIDNTLAIDDSIVSVSNYYKYMTNEEGDKTKNIKMSHNYLLSVVNYACDNLNNIDTIIKSKLIKSSIDSLHITLLSLLRVAISEMLLYQDIPSGVVVSEFTNIANNMLHPNEVGFVNSLLDKVSRNRNLHIIDKENSNVTDSKHISDL